MYDVSAVEADDAGPSAARFCPGTAKCMRTIPRLAQSKSPEMFSSVKYTVLSH